ISLIGMGGESVHYHDFRAQIALDPEDSDARPTLDDATTERVWGLEADDADRVLRIFDGRLEMMHDAPRFAHSTCRDDHRRLRRPVDGFAVFLVLDVDHLLEVERRTVLTHQLPSLGVVALRMKPEDVCDLHREG